MHAGQGELVCCGQPMTIQQEKTQDVGQEKHVPVVEKTESGIKVKIGEIPHPMEENHYIEWIEVITPTNTYKKFLNPGEAPEAKLCIKEQISLVREYCNIHGLWQA